MSLIGRAEELRREGHLERGVCEGARDGVHRVIRVVTRRQGDVWVVLAPRHVARKEPSHSDSESSLHSAPVAGFVSALFGHPAKTDGRRKSTICDSNIPSSAPAVLTLRRWTGYIHTNWLAGNKKACVLGRMACASEFKPLARPESAREREQEPRERGPVLRVPVCVCAVIALGVPLLASSDQRNGHL